MSETTTGQDVRAWLDELDAAREKATAGPWQVDGEHLIVDGRRFYLIAKGVDNADAALIVAAVNALPRLTAAVRAALDLADELDEERDGVEGR